MRQQRTLLHSFLSMVFLIIVVALCPGLRAAITSTGDVNPSYTGLGPWSIESDWIIGNEGDGTVMILDGSDVTASGNTFLAYLVDVTGTLTVDGAGSTFTTEEPVIVGPGGKAC